MSMIIDLSGKTALVTGASQGIGAEVARMLHRAGATVVLNYPNLGDGTTERDAVSIATELTHERPSSAFVESADVSQPDQVASMMGRIRDRLGGLDILVNNAGILRDRTVLRMSLEEWKSVIDTNLSGVFLCSKFGLELIRDGGSIVNLGSLSASAGFHGQANYAAAKAGVQAMTRVLARECARRCIRVNAVAPGVIDTPMIEAVSDAVRQGMLKAIPAARFGSPREVACTVLFLCSDLASYVTGHTLAVDGGWRG
jgi:3-oxoacyl-[acyl-carrier protein] reductase